MSEYDTKQVPGRKLSPSAPNGSASDRLDQFARSEHRIWILAFVVLVALALGLAAVSWQQALVGEARILPVALVVLVVLFGAYVWSKNAQMAELRGLVRGLEHRDNAPPNVAQMERLFEMVERSQQGYRELIDTFDDLLFSVSLEGKILAVNRSCKEFLGKPFGELVGRSLDDFVDLPDSTGRQTAESALPALIRKRTWNGVLRLRVKDLDSVRFFECAVHTLVRDGRDFGIGVLARDVTREKENEARFTELFETLNDGVYVAAGDGRLTDANPALVTLLGYRNREELCDRGLQELFGNAADWAARQKRLASAGILQGDEVVLRRADGSFATCLHNATAIRDSAGNIVRLQGTFVDVTKRLEMERRLHRQQEFVRRVIDSCPDLVVALDPAGACTFVGPRCKEQLGYDPEQMMGRRLAEFVNPQNRADFESQLAAVQSSAVHALGSLDVLLETCGGEARLFRSTASSLLGESGEIEGLVVSMRDFTEARRIEQQLMQTERLAAMGQMVAGAAHELNNPLTAILGIAEMLKDASTDEGTWRHLDLVHTQARRAAQIVQSLLTCARPSHTRKTQLHLGDVIEHSLQFHERSLKANNIAVDFVNRTDVAAVLGDSSQLTQVILNIIVNAEQSIREVRDRGKLRIRLATVGEKVLVTFQDDGAGIRREVLARIFDPFFTTKRPGRGTGLGLSICLAIVREHGGDIEAQNLADGGAVFTLSLPVAKGVPPAGPETQISRPESAPAGSLSNCSVLVVDDEEGIREMVRDGLTSRGARVEVASTGEEALCLLESRDYDVALCDLNLRTVIPSAISGRELHERASLLPGKERRPAFVFMTGDLPESVDLREPGGEPCPVLQKPFRVADLVKLLADVVLQSSARSSSR
jgi:PAS domain S-box-containing protein